MGQFGLRKTYMAAAIANALLEQEKKVLMTDFARTINISKFDADEICEVVGFICTSDYR